MQRLQVAKLFFGKTGLLEYFAERSRRQAAWMHGHIRLSAIADVAGSLWLPL